MITKDRVQMGAKGVQRGIREGGLGLGGLKVMRANTSTCSASVKGHYA